MAVALGVVAACGVAVAARRSRAWLAEIEATGYVEGVNDIPLSERLGGQHEAECKRSPGSAVCQPTQLSVGSSTKLASMSSWRQANVLDTLKTPASAQRRHSPTAADAEAASALQRHFDTAAAHFQCRLHRLQKQLEAREKELKLALQRIDAGEVKMAKQEALADHRAALIAAHQRRLRSQSQEIKQLTADKEAAAASAARSARKAAKLHVLLHNVNTQMRGRAQPVTSGQVVADKLAEEGRRLKDALLTAQKRTPGKGHRPTTLPSIVPRNLKLSIDAEPMGSMGPVEYLSDTSSPLSTICNRHWEPTTPPPAAAVATPHKHEEEEDSASPQGEAVPRGNLRSWHQAKPAQRVDSIMTQDAAAAAISKAWEQARMERAAASDLARDVKV